MVEELRDLLVCFVVLMAYQPFLGYLMLNPSFEKNSSGTI